MNQSFNWKTEYHRYRRYFFNLGKITKVPQIRSFAWFSVTLFTITFFAITAIRPTLLTIAKLNREIKDQKEANQKLQIKINALLAAQAIYAKNIDNLPLLDQALPDKSEFPRLVFFLEENASASGVELKSLGFETIEVYQQKTKSSATRPLTFNVLAYGNYPQLQDFLNRLQSSRRLIKIESVTFGQARKDESPILSLNLRGKAFFMSEQSLANQKERNKPK